VAAESFWYEEGVPGQKPVSPEWIGIILAGFVVSKNYDAENLLKTHQKKTNSLHSNSVFFWCNANFHHLRSSDTPADARIIPIHSGETGF